MQPAEFEAALRRDGFRDIETKSIAAAPRTPDHTHDFDVRALVLEGEITLTTKDESRTYREGDVFTMEAGKPHAETIGTRGVRYLVGRRRPH